MVRIGIVGIGGYGWHLVDMLNEVADECGCRLVAAADARMAELPDRAKQLADAGVELFDDAAKMFDALRGRCDAIYIATGIGSHAALTVAAAEAGFHVHLEKPPAATVQEVDAMLSALDRAGRVCLVGFQALHSDDILRIKDRIVAGRLGKVRTIVCEAGWPRDRAYYGRNEWAGRLRAGGNWTLDGPANNALAHQIMNILLLSSAEAGQVATPAAVRAELYAAGGFDSHNLAAIEIHTADGPTATFLCAHCTDGSFGPTIRVEGEHGRAVWIMGDRVDITYCDGTEETCEADARQGQKMIANFIEAVRVGDGAGLRCDLARARNMTLAMNGAHESSGRIVPIGDEHSHLVDEGADAQRVVVDGLDEAIHSAAARPGLLSDLESAPSWATSTAPFDLAGYGQFPQRFRAD